MMAFALSVRQPWAWLIVNGFKNVENRTWRTQYRGPLVIHASALMTRREYRLAKEFAGNIGVTVPGERKLERGGVVGAACLTDCVEQHSSPWFIGPVGFVLEAAEATKFVPAKGRLGLFMVDVSAMSESMRRIENKVEFTEEQQDGVRHVKKRN